VTKTHRYEIFLPAYPINIFPFYISLQATNQFAPVNFH